MDEFIAKEKRILAKERRKGKAKRYDSTFSPYVKATRKMNEIYDDLEALKEKKDTMDPEDYEEQRDELKKELQRVRKYSKKVEDKYEEKVLEDEPTSWKWIIIFTIILLLAIFIVYVWYIKGIRW